MEKKHQNRKTMEHGETRREKDTKIKKTKNDNEALLKAEMAASLAAKKIWEKKYKEALKIEDERIFCIIEKKEARQKETIDKKIKFRMAKEAMVDKVARKLLDNVCKKNSQEIFNELYEEEQRRTLPKKRTGQAYAKEAACHC